MADTIYLLRHADSAPSSSVPEARWPLTEHGEKQARALAETLAELQFGAVYSSPYQRAVDTARPLARRRGMTVQIDERLRERKLTDQWLDDHMQAIKRVWKDFDLALPGGESSAQCQRRVRGAIDDLAARHREEKGLLLSSHGNAIGLYLNSFDSSFEFERWKTMQRPDLFVVRDEQWERIELD